MHKRAHRAVASCRVEQSWPGTFPSRLVSSRIAGPAQQRIRSRSPVMVWQVQYCTLCVTAHHVRAGLAVHSQGMYLAHRADAAVCARPAPAAYYSAVPMPSPVDLIVLSCTAHLRPPACPPACLPTCLCHSPGLRTLMARESPPALPQTLETCNSAVQFTMPCTGSHSASGSARSPRARGRDCEHHRMSARSPRCGTVSCSVARPDGDASSSSQGKERPSRREAKSRLISITPGTSGRKPCSPRSGRGTGRRAVTRSVACWSSRAEHVAAVWILRRVILWRWGYARGCVALTWRLYDEMRRYAVMLQRRSDGRKPLEDVAAICWFRTGVASESPVMLTTSASSCPSPACRPAWSARSC